MGARAVAVRALAAAALLAGCAGLPPLIRGRDPLSAGEHARLGAAYEAQGLRSEAAEQYAASTRLDPSDAEAWVALGNVSFAGGDLRRAEHCYRRALKASPHHAGASNNLAQLYLVQDRDAAGAERLALDALEQGGPLRPYVLDTLARVYARQGRTGEARAAIAEAEAAGPSGDATFKSELLKTRAAIDAAAGEPGDASP